jgi:hypothetical protein
MSIMSRLFISHSSLNNDKAVEVRDWLAKNGWDDVFLDLDPVRGIAAGQRWKEALQKAGWRCEVVLALVSKEWLKSSWCKSEVDAARLMGKKVIAVLLGIDKDEVPPDLTDEQFIDLTGDPDAYRRLKEGLKRAGLDPMTFPFPPDRRPYPGFAYLEEGDAAVVALAGPRLPFTPGPERGSSFYCVAPLSGRLSHTGGSAPTSIPTPTTPKGSPRKLPPSPKLGLGGIDKRMRRR